MIITQSLDKQKAKAFAHWCRLNKDNINEANSKNVQRKFAEWLTTFNYGLFATFVVNEQISPIELRRLICQFHQRVDRKLLGSNYASMEPSRRTNLVFAFEHIHSNGHGHGLIKPAGEMLERYRDIAPDIWAGLCLKGNLKLDIINNTKEDQAIVCGYMTKEFWKEENYGLFLFSDDFLKSPAR